LRFAWSPRLRPRSSGHRTQSNRHAVGLLTASQCQQADRQCAKFLQSLLASGAQQSGAALPRARHGISGMGSRADPITGNKQPHWFSLPSRPIFTFAGVWRLTETGSAFAFLTCGYDDDPSAHVVGAIHPKAIPVILHEEDNQRWLTAPVEEGLALA
jgi:hypothetical protein